MTLEYDANTGKLNKVMELVEDLATGELVAKQEKSVTERIEEALGKLLMKFKDLEDRIDRTEAKTEDLEIKVDDLDCAAEELRNQVQDFDFIEISSKIEDLETDLEELKDALRNV